MYQKVTFLLTHFFLQMTFQLILSSDGNSSFAALIYKDPERMLEIPGQKQVGFDAGDRRRGVNILGDTMLEGVNLYRIDGT